MSARPHLSLDRAEPLGEQHAVQSWREPEPRFWLGVAYGLPLSAVLWAGIIFAVRALW